MATNQEMEDKLIEIFLGYTQIDTIRTLLGLNKNQIKSLYNRYGN